MNRRKFITNTSASLLTLALTGNGYSRSLIDETPWETTAIGAQVWIYASSLPDYDVSPILGRIFSDLSYAGFEGVETMDQPFRSAIYTRQIKEFTDQYKIKVIGTSFGGEMWNKAEHNKIFEGADMVMSNLASVGGKTFGVSVGEPKGRDKTGDDFDQQANLLLRLISLGEQKGIVLNLHNHIPEVKNNMYDLRGTIKRIPQVKLGPDLNWLVRAGINPVNFLREFKEQIVYLHLRDQLANGKWSESIGEGMTDFGEIARVLKEIHFKGEAIVELAYEPEFIPTRPLRESLKMSRQYIKETMGI